MFINFLKEFFSRDRNWILIILIFAALLRLPFLSYPPVTLFDEVTYANYTIHIDNGIPFFDIHPPLARMLFGGIAHLSAFTINNIPEALAQSFGDFPYFLIRLFIAIIGILLPLIVYVIARKLDCTTMQAGLSALLVIFDNGLVVYSRIMLPDMLLIFFNFTALLFALFATDERHKKYRIFFILSCGIFLGFALSTKWTALGMWAVIGFLFLQRQTSRSLVVSFIIGTFVYLSIFTGYLFYLFPNGGPLDFPITSYSNLPDKSSFTLPPHPRINEVISVLLPLHRAMLNANTIPNISSITMDAPRPYTWAMGRSIIQFWQSSDNAHHVIFSANAFSWTITFLALIVFLLLFLYDKSKGRSWNLGKREQLLIFAYVANYLPFFFIGRTMYLYHYFTALIFLFLLFPLIAPYIQKRMGDAVRDKYFAQFFGILVIVFCFISFFINFKTTYGF